MTGQVEKWGEGLAVRIPAAVAAAAGLTAGRTIEVDIVEGKLVLRPDPDAKRLLDELVAKITPENRHGETDWGPPVGREVW